MTVIKRDGSKEDFNVEKIASAVDKAFKSVNQITPVAIHEAIVNLFKDRDIIGVEEIQDEIEKLGKRLAELEAEYSENPAYMAWVHQQYTEKAWKVKKNEGNR